ncbi:hypothetical protein L596_029150 [Steinernema carpocapsae]|uniref:Uncharacterized protein n=1 Tax=Steinernema carpocapsae TaxID=34508 RepID=A0A4U5LTT7_STECR|nr:hypothetical protein L596_029150 [Steinernema carpocapsae]
MTPITTNNPAKAKPEKTPDPLDKQRFIRTAYLSKPNRRHSIDISCKRWKSDSYNSSQKSKVCKLCSSLCAHLGILQALILECFLRTEPPLSKDMLAKVTKRTEFGQIQMPSWNLKVVHL